MLSGCPSVRNKNMKEFGISSNFSQSQVGCLNDRDDIPIS